KAQPLSAFPLLAELHALQPQDEKIRSLGEQLAERVLKSAQGKVQAGSYSDAAKALGQVPAAFCSESIVAQKRQVDEVVWLERDLKETPLIDEAVVACAQRLNDRLGGKQPKAAQWLAEATKRWQEAKARVDLTLPWSANMGPRFGKELRWLNPLKRFDTDSLKVPGGAAQLQRFSVALGLALQGIEKAPIGEKLAAKPAKGLARFSLMGKKKPTSAWGLDIGATAIKAAKLSLNGDKVSVEQLKVVELSVDAVMSQDDAEHREALRGALAKLKDEIQVKGEPIVASVDSQGCMFRFVSLPVVDEAKFKEMVELEAKHLIPYAEDQVYWYWHRFGTSNTGNREVMIVASRRKEVDDLQTLIEQLGLKISAMQAVPVALLNLTLSDNPDATEPPRFVLELGSSHTHVVASWGNQVFARTISRGGRRLTQQLARELKLTLSEAERTKLAPLTGESPLAFYRALAPSLGDLYLEIERSVRAAEQRGFPTAEAKLLLSGGASRLHGLPRVLCQGADGIALTDES
ncbi:MAG: pilus assembly protein PilM, partial [Planctomycetales bacterium]|nr:pilus assembly protein PilM [Planctomycetales bacterium]